MGLLSEALERVYSQAIIKPEWQAEAEKKAALLQMYMNLQYHAVTAKTSVPSYVIGCIHMMESGFNFKTHLHNGDPLTARTVNRPFGRPKNGEPPFDWHDSAIDAISDFCLRVNFKSLPPHLWSLARCLTFLEKYNGLQYRKMYQEGLLEAWPQDLLGVPSPYLWSGTQWYKKGKFSADGVYDKNLVSKQIGCVPVLKMLTKLQGGL